MMVDFGLGLPRGNFTCDREPWALGVSHGCLNDPSGCNWTHDVLYPVKKVPDTSVAVHLLLKIL